MYVGNVDECGNSRMDSVNGSGLTRLAFDTLVAYPLIGRDGDVCRT